MARCTYHPTFCGTSSPPSRSKRSYNGAGRLVQIPITKPVHVDHVRGQVLSEAGLPAVCDKRGKGLKRKDIDGQGLTE